MNDRPSEQNEGRRESRPIGASAAQAVRAQDSASTEGHIKQRYGFAVNEFIVYPAHGVGKILAIEEQEIAGTKLELFVINFLRDKMTLRVPTTKVANVGMRKIAEPPAIQEVYRTLAKPPHIAKGNWSRLAQEYEAKINSGDIISIAEVMRDSYKAGHRRPKLQRATAVRDRT